MSLIPSPVCHFLLHLTALQHPLSASACVGCGVHVPVSHIRDCPAISFPKEVDLELKAAGRTHGQAAQGELERADPTDRRRARGAVQDREMCSGRENGTRKV